MISGLEEPDSALIPGVQVVPEIFSISVDPFRGGFEAVLSGIGVAGSQPARGQSGHRENGELHCEQYLLRHSCQGKTTTVLVDMKAAAGRQSPSRARHYCRD